MKLPSRVSRWRCPSMRPTVAMSWLVALVVMLSCYVSRAAEPKLSADHAAKMAKGLALFKTNIRGILTAHCVECHGGQETEGELDMTTREGLLHGGESGKVVELGAAEESLLYKLITHQKEPEMPEESAKLKDDEIAAIAKWIDLGAPYGATLVDNTKSSVPWPETKITDDARKYWAFEQLANVTPPTVKDDKKIRTAVDRFIVKRLEAKGLALNRRADKRRLIRRAYFDLTGMPPSPEEVDAFEKDNSPDAYEKVIDRLLASPHFGERWARHWLDLARFGESDGFEQDYDRKHAYHYRDFLIKALNQDMPYDQFLRWQLAGDEIAPNNPLAMMATGFLGAGVFPTQITEKEFEPVRYDEMDDMLATTSMAMLGISVGCARCHDHKFEPIPQADYYRMLATFTKTIRSEHAIELPTEGNLQEFEKRRIELAHKLDAYEKSDLPKNLAAWLSSKSEPPEAEGTWHLPEVVGMKSSGGATMTAVADGSILVTGKNPANDEYTISLSTAKTKIAAVRLETLNHKSLTHGGPGRAANGNFCLSVLSAVAEPLAGGKSVPLALANPRATHQQNTKHLSIASSLSAGSGGGWAVDFGGIGKSHAAVFDLAKPVGFDGGSKITFTLKFQHNVHHSIGRLRITLATVPGTAPTVGHSGKPSPVAKQISQARSKGLDSLDKAAHGKLVEWFKAKDAGWLALHKPLVAHLKNRPKGKKITVMVSSEGLKPRKNHADGRGYKHFRDKTFFLKRGDVNQKQGEATQSFMQALMRGGKDASYWQRTPPQGSRTSYRRTALANWMTDVQYGAGHLAARVIVNRLWQHHLGRGMVATPSDFGRQGDAPSHPQLLDWLASELIRGGWRLKPIHKLIMSSAAYQQSSSIDARKAKVDPENFLLWRYSPWRIEAEGVRDSLLAISGQLDKKMYGPGTLNTASRRRSIYFTVKRSRLVTMMMLFDVPEPLVSQGRRLSTTIAPQALLLMNNVYVRQYAEALATKVTSDAKTPDAKIRRTYRIALGRVPNDKEMAGLLAFLAAQQTSYEAAKKTNASQLALADLCHAVLSLNEVIYVE